MRGKNKQTATKKWAHLSASPLDHRYVRLNYLLIMNLTTARLFNSRPVSETLEATGSW